MSEPLSREQRDVLVASAPLGWEVNWEATVQAAEAARDAARIAVVTTMAERDALARRVEELRSALKEIGRVDVGGLQAIDEYVYDEKENRYQSVKHLLSRVAWRRKVAFDAIAADDAARGEA